MDLSDTQEVDEEGVALCGKEKWRKSKYSAHYSAANLTSQLAASRETLLSSPTGNCGFEVRRYP